MKRRVLVAVKGIKNENLDQIQKVSDAIETIKKLPFRNCVALE